MPQFPIPQFSQMSSIQEMLMGQQQQSPFAGGLGGGFGSAAEAHYRRTSAEQLLQQRMAAAQQPPSPLPEVFMGFDFASNCTKPVTFVDQLRAEIDEWVHIEI